MFLSAFATASIGGFVIWLLFSRLGATSRWPIDHALFVLGVFLTVEGLMSVFLSPALLKLSTQIRSGEFDAMLLLPGAIQLRITLGQANIWRLIDVVIGIVILSFSLRNGASANPLLIATAIGCGMSIAYSLWLLVFSLNLWLLRLENILQLLSVYLSFCRYPFSLYPVWFIKFLTFSTPLAFVSSIPAQVTFGELDTTFLPISIIVACAVHALSQLAFRRAINTFTGI
ncbi:ABC-2 family transporter protein [Burkholderia sp. GS2Y]|uniref:ABC-2 family transporter protein n=1 Tax=Burkholderia theae TaxID=3143496 RepID=A0ABU9WCJ7_9BURK